MIRTPTRSSQTGATSRKVSGSQSGHFFGLDLHDCPLTRFAKRELAKGATEADHVPVGVGDGALPLAMVLVTRTVDVNPHLSPLLGRPVRILTVEVKDTVTRKFVSGHLGQVDREIAFSMREGVGVVMQRRLETCTGEPPDGTRHICHLEDRLESPHQPLPRHELELAVPLSVQSAQAAMADR